MKEITVYFLYRIAESRQREVDKFALYMANPIVIQKIYLSLFLFFYYETLYFTSFNHFICCDFMWFIPQL